MRKQLVAFISGAAANGAFAADKRYNCTNAGGVGAAGDYYFTLGEDGVPDSTLVMECSVGVGSAAADIATPSLVPANSNTVKRVQFRDKGGALVDPALLVNLAFYRIVS